MIVDTFSNGGIYAISILGNDQKKDSLEGDECESEEGDYFIPRHADTIDIIIKAYTRLLI